MSLPTKNKSSFYGCLASIITTTNKIRYEGILNSVDHDSCTIGLAQVRSRGTEDRVAVTYMPPHDDVFELVIFRARDILDIFVHKSPIVVTTTTTTDNTTSPPMDTTQCDPPSVPVVSSTAAAELHPNCASTETESEEEPSFGDSLNSTSWQSWGHLPLGEFDFAKSNKEYQLLGSKPQVKKSCYDKSSSFFDCISSYASGKGTRASRSNVKYNLPQEDFDFEKSQKEFELIERNLAALTPDDTNLSADSQSMKPQAKKSYYNKSTSFFDSISSW